MLTGYRVTKRQTLLWRVDHLVTGLELNAIGNAEQDLKILGSY